MWAFAEAKNARADAERTDLKEGMLLCGLLGLRTGRSRMIVVWLETLDIRKLVLVFYEDMLVDVEWSERRKRATSEDI